MTAAEPNVVPFRIHEKFFPLLSQPHTFADIHGGRYGMKTQCVHLIALRRAMLEDIRILCVRETMSSIKDSSHKMLSDLIYEHHMALSQGGPFEIQSTTILRREGERVAAEFIFAGIRENVRDKKSLANIDLVLFDEAGKCSDDSLTVFLPTIIRKSGCKAWFIWNPELVTDPVYQFFAGSPTNTLVIETDYRDNPWLSEEALNLVEDCRVKDFAKYEHIYLGKPTSEVEGAIFKLEMKAAIDENRITTVPYNRMRPVHTCWDLGFRDQTAIWFVQAYDGYFHCIDYLQAEGLTISDYLVKLQEKGYLYGTDYMPHDALNTRIHKKLAGVNAQLSIEQIMRNAGRKIRLCPVGEVSERINAARTVFPQYKFDKDKCRDGLLSLSMYRWAPLSKDGVPKREPLHDVYSHGSDGFCVAAQMVTQPKAPAVEKPSRPFTGTAWG